VVIARPDCNEVGALTKSAAAGHLLNFWQVEPVDLIQTKSFASTVCSPMCRLMPARRLRTASKGRLDHDDF
jgi:hypothetical protein